MREKAIGAGLAEGSFSHFKIIAVGTEFASPLGFLLTDSNNMMIINEEPTIMLMIFTSILKIAFHK